MRPRARVLILPAAIAFLSASLPAQEAFGTLRRAETGAPAQGTIVVAERLSDGRTIARAVTGTRGTWRLPLTTDRLVIRALRIGFPPHVLDTLQLAAGERRELDAVLPATTVVLPTVRTAADSRCRVRPDSGSLVARVFHEARVALAASQLIAPDGPVRARVRVSEEIWAADEREMLDASHREHHADSLRPFRTASVDSLLEFGFVTRRREEFSIVRPGDEVAVDYRVPGLDLLVDDRFLADYCLHLAEPRPERPEWIGVGFRPARSGRITRIQGTLWLDRRTAELRRLEFGYAGLEGNEARIDPGGWLEFTRLESGPWFVSRWALRVPALGSWLETRGRTTTRVVVRDVPVVRVSGEVLDLAVDGRVVFTAGATTFLRDGALLQMPVPSDAQGPACAGASGHALVFGRVFSASGPALPAAELRFAWRAEGGEGPEWLQTGTRTSSTGEFTSCGPPQDRPIIVEVRAEGHEPAALTLRIGSPRAAARVDLVLVPMLSQPARP